jgi:hypothetical protein
MNPDMEKETDRFSASFYWLIDLAVMRSGRRESVGMSMMRTLKDVWGLVMHVWPFCSSTYLRLMNITSHVQPTRSETFMQATMTVLEALS